MGCRVTDEPDGVAVTGPEKLSGVTIDMGDISDTFMSLAAIAPFADGPVTIENIENVRVKESDRIAAMEENLSRLGVPVESGRSSLRIEPGQPCGATVTTHDDHRIAMSFAVLGLRTPGVVVDDPGCVAKTFPDFFERFAVLEGPV